MKIVKYVALQFFGIYKKTEPKTKTVKTIRPKSLLSSLLFKYKRLIGLCTVKVPKLRLRLSFTSTNLLATSMIRKFSILSF